MIYKFILLITFLNEPYFFFTPSKIVSSTVIYQSQFDISTYILFYLTYK